MECMRLCTESLYPEMIRGHTRASAFRTARETVAKPTQLYWCCQFERSSFTSLQSGQREGACSQKIFHPTAKADERLAVSYLQTATTDVLNERSSYAFIPASMEF
eukprot:1999236-Pleurochrysis_carterae.AAC.2